ncbi:MAG: alcohol dehydrogenase catalytic domain-containing protein [Chloroflexi bacterium]|nr:alcohol dehydrogenase catalytic domain-containing protein [Chloroflexota bacterium]
MKQAIMTSPGEIEFRDIPGPTPGAGEVLLRVQRIGICGSDVHVYHGKHPYTSYPVVQGHEYSALIEAVGPGVKGLVVGQKVTSMPQIVCGQCAPCLRGDYHICDDLKVEGFQAPGCAQELWVTQADRVVAVPDGFSFEQTAMVEPVAVAAHAVRRCRDVAGHNVSVLGAGTIGNLVAQVAQAEGATVLSVDLSDFRLDVAQRCGIRNTSSGRTESLAEASARVFGEVGFDVAWECVGVEPTITAIVDCIAKGGAIVVVGVFAEKPRVDLGLVQDRELNIHGTLMYQRADYERAIELIAEGGVTLEPLMSEHFAFDDYADAYRFIDEQGASAMKVFIDVA